MKMIVITLSTQEWLFSPWVFAPTRDDYSPRPFLPQYPAEIYSNPDFQPVPWMTGVNKDEGAMFKSSERE
jgi:carboxylesterase type B